MRTTMGKWVCVFLICILSLAGCSKSSSGDESKGAKTGQTKGSVMAASEDDNETLSGDIGQTQESKAQKSDIIAVCLPEAAEGWHFELAFYGEKYLKQMVTDAKGYILLTSNSASGQAVQLEGLSKENGIKAAVIYPLDSSALSQSAMKLHNAGVPIITFDGNIDGLTPVSAVTIDQALLGTKAAQKMKTKGSDLGNILIFSNDSSTIAASRIQSFEKGLSDTGAFIHVGDTSGDETTAKELMLTWLKDKEDKDLKAVGGIFAADEASLAGIINALIENDKRGSAALENLKIIAGCGGSNALFRLIETQTKYPVVTFYYSPACITKAISVAEAVSAGESYEDVVEIVPDEIDSKNAQEFIIEN